MSKYRKKSRKKLSLLLMLPLALVFLSYAVILGRDILVAQSLLQGGKADVKIAAGSAKDAEFTRSKAYFEKAGDNFSTARQRLNRPSTNIAKLVPLLGRNIRAARALASAGAQAAYSGRSLSAALMQFPLSDGKPNLGVSNGRIDIKPCIAARPFIIRADDHARKAVEEHEKIPRAMLIPPIRDARDELGSELAKLKEITGAGRSALGVVPGMLGGDKERRYLLAIQNNAELRATGGLIGNYGIIVVKDGKLSLDEFNEISVLQKRNLPVSAPQDFVARYGRFKATSTWSNANMSPDFPTVSRVLLKLYKSNTGKDLDGVISVDPVALEYLLSAIGPVRLPNAGIEIGADDAVSWTLIEAYGMYEKREKRKDFLEEVAKAIWKKLLSGQIGDGQRFIAQCERALKDKHIMLYSAHAHEQKAFEELGYAGALTRTAGDYLQVVVQNTGSNKVDVYTHENIDYSVSLNADGSACPTLAITIRNDTPKSGLPAYVTGEDPGGARDGFNRAYVSAYVPKEAELTGFTVNGRKSEPEVHHERDKKVFSRDLNIAPGASSTIVLMYDLPNALHRDGDKAEYILEWQAQPVINEADISLRLEAPEGHVISSLPSGMTRQGNSATVDTPLAKDERFTIRLSDDR